MSETLGLSNEGVAKIIRSCKKIGLSYHSLYNCNDCVFRHWDSDCSRRLMQEAADRLAEPVKKKKAKIVFSEAGDRFECPNCKKELFGAEAGSFIPRFCPRCGQQLDWGQEELGVNAE